MDGKAFRDLVSGKRKGFKAGFLRGLLFLAAIPYACIVTIRNKFYDLGVLKSGEVSVPTLSIGNITLGGTGKSPLVAWIGDYYLKKGIQPGIISRGYRSSKQADGQGEAVNDEFLELAFRFPTVAHVQNPNRIAAAKEILNPERFQPPVELIILDDAMQHRKIERDLNIVLLDATEPFGFEHIFPRGTLREPLSALRRADVVFLSRADLVSDQIREQIKKRVENTVPGILWGEIAHAPDRLIASDRKEKDISLLQGKRVFAFCGIGNPSAFRHTLESCGAEVVEMLVFPDHHHYSQADWKRLEKAIETCSPDFVLCTMKDRVKLDKPMIGEKEVLALSIQIRFLEGENEFRDRLDCYVK